MRARVNDAAILRFPTGVYSTAPSVQYRVYMHVFAPLTCAKLFCGHRNSTLRLRNSCTSRSSREYGPPRVVSQRSEEYELSMNPTVSYPIVSYFINKLSVTQMCFTDLTLCLYWTFFNDAPVYSIKSLAAFKRTVHRALARPVLQEPYLVQQAHLS